MKTTNLGDSGYLLLRPTDEGEIIELFKSEEQVYSFNFPYQCGTGAELPYDAVDMEHKILDDDIIVMATDGVFDNLYNKDIIKCVKSKLTKDKKLKPMQEVADCIAKTADEYGKRKDYESPFAKSAREHGKKYPNHGKEDDVTVIVAQIETKKRGREVQPITTNGKVWHE